MTAAEAVAQRLGGRKVLHQRVSTELELRDVVRKGLPAASLDFLFASLVGRDVPQSVIYKVIGTERTLQRKRTEGRALSHDESDKLSRLARLLVRAEEALDSPDKAIRWMTTPNRALAGQPPITLLDSDAGALAVDQVLGRIEHGVFS
jgi:putative toxin-antitoxin system antitoxin component (TIGR02293 family)